MQVQLSHPARTIEIKGPKKVKDLLRELNLVVEDEMVYDGCHIEIRPVISNG
ncbi:MAG: thiamine biosynthesis protein ThiS [Nitrospirota bacterium]